jgi:cytochrome P450
MDERDLLTTLLIGTDQLGNPLTQQQIHDEVMTVLLAGHESTANAITWMCWLLAKHPVVVNQLRVELSRVLGGCLPTQDNLKDLPYNAMVVKEALRLYPPAWALPREAIEDTEIGGYPIRRGSLLLGVPFLIQRDARYYDQPDAFLPERFADNAERHLPQHVYMPFGGGPRFCVGSTFALLAMQLTLATVYQRYDLQLITDQPVVLDPLLTLRPRYGVHMRATTLETVH